MNSVPTGGSSDQKDRIVLTPGTCPGHLVDLHHAYTHGIYQRIPGVGVFEIYFSCHRRDSEAVPVVSDSPYHPVEQVADSWRGKLSETERIQAGYGPRPHGEDVP